MLSRKVQIEKVAALILAFVIIFTGFETVSASSNLCKNPDFEKDTSYWTAINAGSFARSTEKAHSGKASGRMAVTGSWGTVQYDFNFQKNVTYEVSMWITLDDSEDKERGAYIILDHGKYGNAEPRWEYVATGNKVSSDKWTELKFSYTYTGGNKTGGAVMFPRIGSGEETLVYYIDDVSITSSSAKSVRETVWAEDELIDNKGFDTDTDGWVTSEADICRVSDVVYDNSAASGLVNITGKSGYVGYSITVKKGKKYNLSAMLKTFGENVLFRYGIENSGGDKLFLGVEKEIDADWTKITDTYIPKLKNDEENIIIYVGCNNLTSFYIDDFSVIEKDAATAEETNASGNELQILINGRKINFSKNVLINDNKVIAPLRELSESVGAVCSYNPEDNSVVIEKGINRIVLNSGNTIASVNGIIQIMRAAPEIIDSTYMCDAEFLLECLNYKGYFDPVTNILNMENEKTELAYSAKSIKEDKELKIGFLRASNPQRAGQKNAFVTPMTDNIYSQIKGKFNDCNIEVADRDVSGSGAMLGAFRISEDMKDMDLIFIDVAQNDLGCSEEEIKKYVEGMVRSVKNSTDSDIVFLYSLSDDVEKIYDEAKIPEIFKIYDKVASYYDVPVLNIGKILYDKCVSEGKTFANYSDYSGNPNTFGMQIYADAVVSFIDEGIKNAPDFKKTSMPRSMAETEVNGKMDMVINGDWDENWSITKKKFPGTSLAEYIESHSPGAELTYKFTGKTIGLYVQSAPDCGDILWTVDGGEYKSCSLYDEYSYSFEHAKALMLTDELEDGEHTLTIKVDKNKNENSIGNYIRIGAFLIDRRN